MDGAQGQFGAAYPTNPAKPTFFQTLVGYNPNQPLRAVDVGTQQAQRRNVTQVTAPIRSNLARLTGAAPWWGTGANLSGSPDDRNGLPPGAATYPGTGSGRTGRETLTNQPQTGGDDYYFRKQAADAAHINILTAALERGDFSVLSGLPPADLEAMGLGSFAGTQATNAQGKGETDSDYISRMTGIGTGVDEGKEMTSAQLEERYYKNKAIEAEFLQQKRWDADKRKYITVGEWMKNESKRGRRRHKRGGGKNKKDAAQYTLSYGVVTFNTGTG